MNRQLIGSLVALAALAPAPAVAQVYPERVAVKPAALAAPAYQRRGRDDGREEQTERTTKTFRLGASGTLTLGNIAGDITVTRAGGGDTTVEIVKTARGRDLADAKQLLQLVTVDVGERPGRVDVKARYPPGDDMRRFGRRNLNVSVAYTVSTPAGTHLSVETISGSVRVADIKGDVSANSISGDVRVSGGGHVGSVKSISGTIEVVEAQGDGLLDASSVSGDVILRRIAVKRVQSGSVSGNIRLEDLQADRVDAHTTSGSIAFSGQLTRGGRYDLKGFSGEVRVALAGSTGFEIDASTFSGQIRSDDFPITTRGRIGRRSLSGTWGDGSATLDVSTFSGSIVIAKR